MDRQVQRRRTLYEKLIRENFFPFVMMSIIPNATIIIVYLVVRKQSNFHDLVSKDVPNFWRDAWKAATIRDRQAWLAVLGLTFWSAASLIVPLGGKKYYTPPTPTGYRAEFVDSGSRYYIITMLIGAFAAFVYPGHVPGWYLYKKLVPISGVLFVFGFACCSFLFVKGHLFPSPGLCDSSGSPIFDFYWGLELYPRLGKTFDIKQWAISRFGMMAWQLLVLICWKAQIEKSGWNWAMAATSVLQTIYIAKHFFWERGYITATMDFHLDRAGFYLCWSSICYLPMIYGLTSLFMVEHAPNINFSIFVIIVSLGCIMLGLTYWVDSQREVARRTNGNCIIWGQPAKIIRVSYSLSSEKEKKMESILLASGFWGLARHMNYVFEMATHFSWALPAMFDNFLPYSCCTFLAMFLIHRTFRDEAKCRQKYGKYWEEYCSLVPSRLIPGIF